MKVRSLPDAGTVSGTHEGDGGRSSADNVVKES
ncbi:MAG TPA: hypothetical protein DEF41_00120 [Desulfovibrio sp.]|nr:hypothetical protein [Desulfovibrio sp.]